MKKSNLKSLINHIIREAVINKIGEGQPVGGVKNDHLFDDGRNNVMKAVNVAETTNENRLTPYQKQVVDALIQRKFKIKKYTNSPNGQINVILELPYNNIAHNHEYRFCNVNSNGRINRNQMDVNTFLKGVIGEKVGFDGKYVDDMESGVAVKKLHSLDENFNVIDYNSACRYLLQHGFKREELPSKEDGERYIKRFNASWWGWTESWMNSKFEPTSVNENRLTYKQRFVYPENFKSVKNYIRIVRRPETNEFVVTWYENGRLNEDKSYFTDDIKDAWDTFNHMKTYVDKANSTMNEGLYPEVTLQMNRMGRIHMWKGKVEPIQVSKYNYTVKGKKSEVYFQNDSDVNEILRSLSPEESKELEEGWPVVTTNISDEYFGLNEMSSTGGSSGSGMEYQTPFAFSKKSGSKRALDVTKKMGFKKVKDID